MAGTAVRGRLTWQVATVTSVTKETDSVRTIALAVPDWPGHQAGQHVDVRLIAEDGYAAARSQPPGWTGYSGRVDAAMLAEIAWPASQDPLAFVCAPTSFVEAVAEKLVGLGYPPGRVKTERFGGS